VSVFRPGAGWRNIGQRRHRGVGRGQPGQAYQGFAVVFGTVFGLGQIAAQKVVDGGLAGTHRKRPGAALHRGHPTSGQCRRKRIVIDAEQNQYVQVGFDQHPYPFGQPVRTGVEMLAAFPPAFGLIITDRGQMEAEQFDLAAIESDQQLTPHPRRRMLTQAGRDHTDTAPRSWPSRGQLRLRHHLVDHRRQHCGIAPQIIAQGITEIGQPVIRDQGRGAFALFTVDRVGKIQACAGGESRAPSCQIGGERGLVFEIGRGRGMQRGPLPQQRLRGAAPGLRESAEGSRALAVGEQGQAELASGFRRAWIGSQPVAAAGDPLCLAPG